MLSATYPAAKQKQKPTRVLLVDDDADIVEAVSMGLRKRGYTVDTFNDPSAALAAFSPKAYDVAVLDVRMGHMDGLELYRRLKGLDPRLLACFLTAYADVIKDKPNGIRFLQKPISLADLVQALKDIEAAA